METIIKPACPRCLGYVPNNAWPGQYPGALSRTDNKTEICSSCGTEEAMLDFGMGELPSQDRWPVVMIESDYFDSARSRHLERLRQENS